MSRVLIVDNSERDAQRLGKLLAKEDLVGQICASGSEAEALFAENSHGLVAAFIAWDLQGSVSGFDLLLKCRKTCPDVPVVIISSALDATMATRAFALGARDFLEKPVDSGTFASCLRSLLAERHPVSPLVERIGERIIGQAPALIAMFKQAAKIIPEGSSSVLITGESGTGKELLAQAIHNLGPRDSRPLVAINVGAIPSELIESALFGHEKGAFTSAADRHIGYFEEAGDGTIFLDEIGDLQLSLQSKLLRVIEGREFRRLKGVQRIPFNARLLCATNKDLAEAVAQGDFRRDLFHRIAEVTISVPPLRERTGDVDLLIRHFLKDSTIRLSRETLTILRSYPFDGNIRELKNLIREASLVCDGDVILPQNLPLRVMGTLMGVNHEVSQTDDRAPGPDARSTSQLDLLISDVRESMPQNWPGMRYRDAAGPFVRAFDRVFLKSKLERAHYSITQAAKEADLDTKTFRRRWKESGLPQLEGERSNSDASIQQIDPVDR